MRISDLICVSLAVFAGFGLALAADHILLKCLLSAMRLGLHHYGSRNGPAHS